MDRGWFANRRQVPLAMRQIFRCIAAKELACCTAPSSLPFAARGRRLSGRPLSGTESVMEFKVEKIDYAKLDALIRDARAARDREVGRLMQRGASALGSLVKAAGASLIALYEADRERSSRQARTALRRWAGRS
jgi:hypothetical protein